MSPRCPALVIVLAALGVQAQERPDEGDMFGAPDAVADGGAAPVERPSDDAMFGSDAPSADAGLTLTPETRDDSELAGPSIQSKFDTDEMKADTLKVGGNLLISAQSFARENVAFKDQSFAAPMVLETFLDGRPNDRLRAFAVGRLSYDPTRPASTGSAASSTTPASSSTGGASSIGLLTASGANPNVQLDQLWLRFDIARAVYLTVGRQKVRWGVSRIWYPTDFLNSQPRDALNPFDIRLGVNMVKVHVPVESLGWNFYGYGILDNIAVGASGLTLERLAGAVRGEFVLGPAELGVGGVWQAGRRPRYAVDISTPLGPFDVYAEAALRDARDFLKYRVPSDVTSADFIDRAIAGDITSYRPTGLGVQVSGGFSWQFNYTDKNTMIVSAEYFYNPYGYANTMEYLVETLAPSFVAQVPGAVNPGSRDPIQSVPMYQSRHSAALVVTAPGLPNLSWVSLTLSNIVSFSDPSALTRFDASFRVLQYLTVQAFVAVFYGKPGGELRFRLPADDIADQVSPYLPVEQRLPLRASLRQAEHPPLLQAGVLLRLSI